ncbi:MAG: S41 family peptidase [Bacteroidota bacterium]
MKHITYILILLFPTYVCAQNCDCTSVYQWVKETIETNDAGYQYALERKGVQAYQAHNKVTEEKAIQVKEHAVCEELMRDWLTFFRSGHIEIAYASQESASDDSDNKMKPAERYKDWETLDLDPVAFQSYLQKKESFDFEGIWETKSGYEICISKQGDGYIGSILSSKNPYWTEGQVKLRIHPVSTGWSATFYMKDHSAKELDQVFMIGENYLQLGSDFSIMNRVGFTESQSPEISRYIRRFEAEKPFFQKLDNQTAYICIPSFRYEYKKNIDKLVKKNLKEILSTPNLIIDIRNNDGGSDASFRSITPVLYTDPIRTPGVEFLSTTTNKESMLGFAQDERYDEETRAFAQQIYDAMDGKEGTFVNVFEEEVSITQLDTVYPYPSQIAILMNEGNYSSAEQFLLNARQSQKVKLMGTSSAGVIDISNMTATVSPCGNYQLAYALSKSQRIPNMAVDGHGVQPDYFIDSTIPPFQWISFAQKILSQ